MGVGLANGMMELFHSNIHFYTCKHYFVHGLLAPVQSNSTEVGTVHKVAEKSSVLRRYV